MGRNADALAAHRSVLAARRELAAEPGADAAAQADVGRSLTEVAGLLESAGKTDEAAGRLPRGRGPALRAGGELVGRPAALAGLPVADGRLSDRRSARMTRRWPPTAWPGPTRRSWPRPPATPSARRDLGDTVNRIGRLLANTGRPREATEAEYRAALAIRKKLADASPAVTEFRNAWRPATTTSASCC